MAPAPRRAAAAAVTKIVWETLRALATRDHVSYRSRLALRCKCLRWLRAYRAATPTERARWDTRCAAAIEDARRVADDANSPAVFRDVGRVCAVVWRQRR